ncbi:MAG TPA: hypothetical protein DHU33_04365 [Firmicutes bacterium]|nr:hypothetical protein [Bacillota bacterium]
MKKVVKLIGTLGCVLLLCGCGSKKMSCTMDTDDEVMKSNVLMNVSFKKNSIDTIKISSNYEIKDEYKDIVQTIKDSYDEVYNISNKNIKYKSSLNDNKIDINLELKYPKLDDEAKTKLGLNDFSGNRDEVKTKLSDLGYTCK